MNELWPEEIRAPLGARMLEVVWSDGSTSQHSHRILRGFCPCAECQGHVGPVGWVGRDTQSLALSEIEPVGNYGVRLVWEDGHGAGIYTFVFLQQLRLVEHEPAEVLQGITFQR